MRIGLGGELDARDGRPVRLPAQAERSVHRMLDDLTDQLDPEPRLGAVGSWSAVADREDHRPRREQVDEHQSAPWRAAFVSSSLTTIPIHWARAGSSSSGSVETSAGTAAASRLAVGEKPETCGL